MKILSHRGHWEKAEEKNTIGAIQRAIREDDGFESDIRDFARELIISHNMADADAPKVETILESLRTENPDACFAINIKADGLAGELLRLLDAHGIKNYFAFDMSVPQMLEYRARGLRYFSRQSEYEPMPILYREAAGVWIDAFQEDAWIDEPLLAGHLRQEKIVCLVSPELHQRPHLPFWTRLRSYHVDFSKIYLCTDVPEEAKHFFERQREAGK